MNQDLSTWQTLAIAFQTLGVVYGDMGTSPLYVFADVFSKVQIDTDVDVLGALSLVMYTIALLPLAKYVFVVLKANDNGEGKYQQHYPLALCRIHLVNTYEFFYTSNYRRNVCPVFADKPVCKG